MVLSGRLPQAPQVIRRPLGRDGLPGLLDEQQAEGARVGAHLALEGVDDAEGADGIEGRVHLRDGVHLEDHEARVHDVRGVGVIEDGAEAAGLPVGVQGDAQRADVEHRRGHFDAPDDIGLRRPSFPEDTRPDLLADEPQEILKDRVIPLGGEGVQEVPDDAEEDGVGGGVPASPRRPYDFQQGYEKTHPRHRVRLLFPSPAARHRVERVRVLRAPCVVDAVPAAALLADDGAEPLVGTALVDDEHVLPAVIAVAHVPGGEERLPRARRAQDEGVVVLDELRREGCFLGVQDHGRVAVAVGDAQAPSGEVPREGLVDGKAHGLLQLCDEKVVLTDLHGGAGEARNPELGRVDRVELAGEPHRREGRAGGSADGELLLPRTPREDVHMGVDRDGRLGVNHVDETRDPFGVDGVLGASLGHRGHVLAPPVQLAEGVLLAGEEPVHIDDVLVAQTRPDGGGGGEEDVRLGARQGPNLQGVGDLSREVVRAGERVGEQPPGVPVQVRPVRLDDIRGVHGTPEPALVLLDDPVRPAGHPFEVLRAEPSGVAARGGRDRRHELRAAAHELVEPPLKTFHLGGAVADAAGGSLERPLHRPGAPSHGRIEGEPEVLGVLEVLPSLEMCREAVIEEVARGLAVVAPLPVDVLLVDHRPLGEAPEGGSQQGGHGVVLLLREGVLLGGKELPPDGDCSITGDDGPVHDKGHGEALLEVERSGRHFFSRMKGCRTGG